MLRNSLGLLLLGISGLCMGAEAVPPELDAVKQVIESRYPDVRVLDVRKTPVPGLLELYLGDSVAYTDTTGDYLLVGSLFNTRERRDLSAESISARNTIDFASLPFDKAIVTVKGNGKRRLAVFSDPDCPYCEQLEKELESVTDVTIHTFLYPLVELHPDAARKARNIWCSADRSLSWRQWMIQRREPVDAGHCEGVPTEGLLALGKQLKITGTPTLYLGNGQRIDGAVNAQILDQRLTASPGKTAAR